MTDIIVYNQNDLDRALSEKQPSIMLCAGLFVIHKTENTVFKRLGPVRVIVTCSRISADEAGMRFVNINPEFNADYAISTIAGRSPVAATFECSYGSGSYSGSGSYLTGSGSYLTSSGSYLSGSGSNRYTYEYEYEYQRSYKGSFVSSFSGSLSGSFVYLLSGSLSGSFAHLLNGSFTQNGSLCAHNAPEHIKVFGYGINLI